MCFVIGVSEFRRGDALIKANIFQKVLIVLKPVFLSDLLQRQIGGYKFLPKLLAADGIDICFQPFRVVAAKDPV